MSVDAKEIDKTFANHPKFPNLQKSFNSHNEVMKACVTCHNESGGHIQEVLHWVWKCDANNTRVQIEGEDMSGDCIDCHSDFQSYSQTHTPPANKTLKADCLICHDTSDNYAKHIKGHSKKEPPLPAELMKKIGNGIGYPTRNTCGYCHFAEEHTIFNDLNNSFIAPDKTIDVHMDQSGINFQCSMCHSTFKHTLSDNCETTSLEHKRELKIRGDGDSDIGMDFASCESCHSQNPHKSDQKLNDHTDIVACQTCHITDKRTPGPIEYHWYSGVTIPEKYNDLPDGTLLRLRNTPLGRKTAGARLFPFRATKEESTSAEDKQKHISATKTYWPINHGVSPKEQALACVDCHKNGPTILAALESSIRPYILGNYEGPMDLLAYLGIFLTMMGVSIHGGIRLTSSIFRKMKRK